MTLVGYKQVLYYQLQKPNKSFNPTVLYAASLCIKRPVNSNVIPNTGRNMDIYIGSGLGLISGVVLTLLSVVITKRADRKVEKNKTLVTAEFEINQKLGELEQNYFWISSNELHQRKTGESIIKEVSDSAIALARLVYENEESEFSKEILQILYDESYKSCNERWKHMLTIQNRMGKKIRPIYKKYAEELNEKNIQLMEKEDFKPNAPASARFRMGV